MEFFNDLSRRFSNVAKSVSEKTKDGVEVTRIASDLRGAKAELEQLYTQLGRICYGIRMGEGEPEQAEQLAQQIQKVRARVEELTAQRDAIREVRRCPGCGMAMPRDARFCSNCGKRLPEDAPHPEAESDVREYCPDCGAQRLEGERFCSVCGKSFEDASASPESTSSEKAVQPAEIDVEEPGEAAEE